MSPKGSDYHGYYWTMIAPPDYTLYSKHNTYYGTNGIRIRPFVVECLAAGPAAAKCPAAATPLQIMPELTAENGFERFEL